jgi:hypothetical protein
MMGFDEMSFDKKRHAARTADEYIEQLPETLLRALSVWLTLNSVERAELLKASELFDSLPEPGQQQLRDIIINVRTGPFGEGCPYCGR